MDSKISFTFKILWYHFCYGQCNTVDAIELDVLSHNFTLYIIVNEAIKANA